MLMLSHQSRPSASVVSMAIDHHVTVQRNLHGLPLVYGGGSLDVEDELRRLAAAP